MGQKVHPIGFRLGNTTRSSSLWYAKPKTYSKAVAIDCSIRRYLTTKLKRQRLNSFQIIHQYGGQDKAPVVQVQLWTTAPRLIVESHEQGLSGLRQEMESLIVKNSKKLFARDERTQVSLQLKHAAYASSDVWHVATTICESLEQRMPFRRAMTKAMRDASQVERIQGIKVQLSGRLNGAEIARTEWIREGQLPLTTLRSKIDYIHREAHTLYGLVGVKVWIFYGLIN